MTDSTLADDAFYAEPEHAYEGVHEMPADRYHADPCPRPSLNASIAKILIEQSPAHARAAHPRLNPLAEGFNSSRLDLGTVCHTLALGTGKEIVSIDAENWTTKAAKQARDEARAAGKTPILAHVLDEAHMILSHLGPELERHGLAQLWNAPHAKSESVFIAKEGELFLRCMVDRHVAGAGGLTIFDYKTAADVSPTFLQRQVVNMGYDVQDGHYTRVAEALFPEYAGRVRFVFLFQEITAPYCVVPVELDGTGKEIGRRKATAAARLFEQCLDVGHWPSYPAGIARPDYPAWAETAWMNREQFDPLLESVRY